VQVDAKPLARSFRWFFNSSGGSFEIPSAKPLMSFMNYAESDGGKHDLLLYLSLATDFLKSIRRSWAYCCRMHGF
jgi:hypothetical protein